MPTPLPPPLTAALAFVAERLDDAGVDWMLAGSCARALQGFAVEPRDLDIEVAPAHLGRAAAALGLTPRRHADPTAVSERATGPVAGVEVDLTAGLVVRGPGGVLPADHALARLFGRTARVGTRAVVVMPFEEQVARAVVRGDGDRLDRLAAEAPSADVLEGTYLALRLAAARSTAAR
jgi:hypothetical protein